MDPGEFGSDSGTVVVVSADVGFPISAFVAGVGRGASWGYAVGTTGSDKPGRMAVGSWGYGVGASYHEATGYGAGASYGRAVAGGDWLLSGGIWNDASVWDDAESWED